MTGAKCVLARSKINSCVCTAAVLIAVVASQGCLLAVLFVVPFLARSYHVSAGVLGLFVTIYVSIIVPIGTGIVSKKYIIGRLRKFVEAILNEKNWYYFLAQLSFLTSWLHFVYIQLDGVHVTTMQVVFNLAAEKVFCPEQRMCCLYVLLFYSVLAYLQRSLRTRPWTQMLNESSTAEFIKLTTAFIIVRLGKGVALSLVLLTFTLQFNHLEPDFSYVTITFLFFCVSQYQSNTFVKHLLTGWLSKLELQVLEGLEEYWVPVLTNLVSILFSVSVFAAVLVNTNSYIVLVILGYANIFVPYSHSLQNAWQALSEQKAVISKYPLASWKNPQIRGGYSCAICLDKMRLLSARCTPCGHVFHGSCLRKCLLYSNQCPLCKHEL